MNLVLSSALLADRSEQIISVATSLPSIFLAGESILENIW